MGPPRKCNEKSLNPVNSSNKKSTARNVRKTTTNCTEKNETVSDQSTSDQPVKSNSQKTSPNNISVFDYLNNITYGDFSKPGTRKVSDIKNILKYL